MHGRACGIGNLQPQFSADALPTGSRCNQQKNHEKNVPVIHNCQGIYHEVGGKVLMPMSDYMQQLRRQVGHDLLLLPSAAVVIHDAEMRVLLCLHRDKNIWVAPGGLIEPGEHPAEAAVRETWEETGLIVELTGILGVYGGHELVIDYPNGDTAAYVGT